MPSRNDISEQIRTLAEATDGFDFISMLGALSDGITVQDRTKKLIYANDVAARLSGYPNGKELVAAGGEIVRQAFEVFDENGEPIPWSHLPGMRALNEGLASSISMQYRTSGSPAVKWSEIQGFPLFDSNGEIAYAVNVFKDITQQKLNEERLKFLASASEVLSSSLDYNVTLKSIANLAVPKLADWCAIDMLKEDGRNVERLAVAHVDPQKVRWAHELQQKTPYEPDAPTGVPNVLRTGKSEFYPIISDDMLVAAARNDQELALLREIGFTSVMIVPLIVREDVIGAITFVSTESERTFTNNDLLLAEETARRAATAVDNAHLYYNAKKEIEQRTRIDWENRELLAEVERQRERLDNIISSVPGVIWEAWGSPDRDNQWIDYVSEHVESMLGYTQQEWLDTPNFWLTIVHPDDRDMAARDSAAIFQSGTTGSNQFRWITRDGRTIWVEAHAVSLTDANGTPIGMRGVTMDITERKLVEEHLEQARHAAEIASQAKDRFLAVLSHELRTPLTPVLAIAQALLDSDDVTPPQLHEYLEMIHRNVELEARLIDDLLDINRIALGKLRLNIELASTHSLLRNVVDICRGDIRGRQIRLSMELAAEQHYVRVDTARLQQVFWNIAKNAVKFTPEGGEISIASHNDQSGHIVIEIRDNGVGISADILPRIFDAFEQEDRSMNKESAGLGLGLSISRTLMEMHGGGISAESAGYNEGSVFTIWLETVAANGNAQSHPSQYNAPTTTSTTNTNYRILIVDDHADTNRVMQLLLEREGYHVITASSVSTALSAAQGRTFDLVISDIGLPDGTGLELIETLLADGPVTGIAMSGFGMEEDIRRSMDAGFREHLTKPVSFKKLHEVIRRLLQGV